MLFNIVITFYLCIHNNCAGDLAEASSLTVTPSLGISEPHFYKYESVGVYDAQLKQLHTMSFMNQQQNTEYTFWCLRNKGRP